MPASLHPSLHGYTGVSCRAGMITCQSCPGCWAGFTFRLKSHGQRNTGPLSSSVLPLVRGAGFHGLYTPRPSFLSCLSQPTWTLSSPPKGIKTQPSPTCLPTLAWVILTGSLGYPLLASRPHPTHCLFPGSNYVTPHPNCEPQGRVKASRFARHPHPVTLVLMAS